MSKVSFVPARELLMLLQFIKVGLLTKRGGNNKNWLPRIFALQRKPKLLFYFKTIADFERFDALSSDQQMSSHST